ncbi:MAG: type IV pilin protein [Phycisphaerae bacterium]
MKVAHRQPAFTLLELVIMFAIVAILASMAIPRFSRAAARQRADAAAR